MSGEHDQKQPSGNDHLVPPRWLTVILTLLAVGFRQLFRLLAPQRDHLAGATPYAGSPAYSSDRPAQGLPAIAPPPNQSRMTKHYFFVLILILAAAGAGIAHSFASKPVSVQEGDLSSCVAPVKAAEQVTIQSTGQALLFNLKETITLKLADPITRKLIGEASTNDLFYNECYFEGFAEAAVFTSSGNGLASFSNEFSAQENLSELQLGGWSSRFHDGYADLDFRSYELCNPSQYGNPPGWNGTHLVVSVSTSASVSALSPLPDSHSGDNYGWSYAKLDCKSPPSFEISARVPLVTYIGTQIANTVNNAHSTGMFALSVLNWLPDIVLLLAGVAIWILNRRFIRSASRTLILLGISALGLAATFYYGYSDVLTETGLLFGMYGVVFAIMLPGRTWHRLVIGGSIAILFIAAAVYHSHYENPQYGQGYQYIALLVAVLVVILMLSSGVLAFKRLRTSLHDGCIAGNAQAQAGHRLDLVVLYTCALAAVAVSYSLGNVSSVDTTAGGIALSESIVLQYAIAPFVGTIGAVALVLPLIERGATARKRQLWGGAIGLSFVVELPDPTITFVSFPIAEVIFAVALVRLIAQRSPEPNLTSARSRLRTCVPGGNVPANIWLAAKIATVIAIVPVTYFVYTALKSLPRNLHYQTDAISVAAGIIAQAVGWIVIGVVFSIINNRLPGGNGPVRAFIVSALWFAVGTIGLMLEGWLHDPVNGSWAFFGLQLLLFLLAFSAVWDACILGKLSWSSLDQLRDAYSLQRVRTVALYGAPLLLTIIALGQQVLSGSGVQFVQSALNAVPTIFGK